MNVVAMQGVGEALDGLSAIVRSQLSPCAMPDNERNPLMNANEMILEARMHLSVALAANLDNELNQSGD